MNQKPKQRAESNDDPRAFVDIRIDTPGREGLTGTTPADVYAGVRDPEHVTIPPDGRPHEQQPQWRQDFPIDWPQDHYVARRLHQVHGPDEFCVCRRPVL